MRRGEVSNEEIADRLDHVADLLELEDQNAFRIRSYRDAAQTIRHLDRPVAELMQQDGEQVLRGLPGIGARLAGSIQEIAPKRFNPEGEAWLPVMNVKRRGWSFTLLFSNTALAHRTGKTHDWVVIYHERGGQQRQSTVVTSQRGKLQGKRVVRGRERESREYYGLKSFDRQGR